MRKVRKVLLGLTVAAALGALAIPNVASAANNHGASGGGRSAGVAAHSFSGASGGGARFNANVGGSRNYAARGNVQNFAVNNNARINRNAGTWNGKRWADNDGRHHRRHDRARFFGFVPFDAYGDYAAYDSCWQTILTPAGLQRVYICGPDGYGIY
jgi:hypothetical protein